MGPFPDDPRYAWFPGVVLKHDEGISSVRFYDCTRMNLPDDTSVIPIGDKEFEYYTTKKIYREKSLIGNTIVGFNQRAGAYLPGNQV